MKRVSTCCMCVLSCFPLYQYISLLVPSQVISSEHSNTQESQKAAEEKEASMKALQREHRRTEAKLISKGKKPFYLKKGWSGLMEGV